MTDHKEGHRDSARAGGDSWYDLIKPHLADLASDFERGRPTEGTLFCRGIYYLSKRLRESAVRGYPSGKGTPDEALLRVFETLGITRDSMRILHLFPLAAIGRAGMGLPEEEQAMILAAATAWDVPVDSRPSRLLSIWLLQRMDWDYEHQILEILVTIESLWPGEGFELSAWPLSRFCRRISEAVGSFLGFGKTIPSDQLTRLDRITKTIANTHPEASRVFVDRMLERRRRL